MLFMETTFEGEFYSYLWHLLNMSWAKKLMFSPISEIEIVVILCKNKFGAILVWHYAVYYIEELRTKSIHAFAKYQGEN